MHLDPSWSFEQALNEISGHYRPGAVLSGPSRNRLIEAWGQIVGPRRAVRELDQAVSRYSSPSAFCRANQIALATLRNLRADYLALPDDPRESGRVAAGDVLGEWQLVSRLDSGGNADVWRARSAQGEVALKVLRRASGEPRRRFRAEINLLRSLQGVSGVLQLTDSHSEEDRILWYAMPIATPVLQFAELDQPESIVAGIAHVADTMTKLYERGVSHRDLKPSNLFVLNEDWIVGDFGIASYPGKPGLTRGSTKLGPVHFIAPEMLNNPNAADPGPADVYSLSKTMWVLLTGQTYPPPGEQRQDVEQVRLENWVKHKRVAALNPIIEQCTRHAALDRMSMAELRDSLVGWLPAQD